jgi:hypothetical protein
MRALIIMGFIFALIGFGVACYNQFVVLPAVRAFEHSANYSEWLEEEYSLTLQISLIHTKDNFGLGAMVLGFLSFGLSCISFLKTRNAFSLFVTFFGLAIAGWGIVLGFS